MLFAYEPALQPNADYVKAKLGDKVQLVRFDGDGHALCVDEGFRSSETEQSLSVEEVRELISMPKKSKPGSLPANQRLRLDHDERIAPVVAIDRCNTVYSREASKLNY